jgi:DNA-binding protein YbaB
MAEYADRDANRGLKARFAEIQGSYERVRDGLAEFQQRLAALQVTATSAEDLVSATVDARGQLVRLGLHPRVLRARNHEELEQLILSTVRRATAQATDQVADLMAELSPTGSNAAAFVRSGDYNDLLRRTDEIAGYRPDEPRG